MWSFAVAATGCCGLTSVSTLLGDLLGRDWGTVRQRLREWYWDAAHKKGDQRVELDVTSCFVPLLQWILGRWPPEDKRVALAMDATKLGDRFAVLAISLLYRGCAIPIAWVVTGANEAGTWRPHWLGLLARLQGGIPHDWLVIVMADRGLYANWLFAAIVDQGWHPFLRINVDGKYRRLHGKIERRLSTVVPRPGTRWSGRIACFKTRPLTCTLLANWADGCSEPCLVLTDLPPKHADVDWYRLRMWIESGFKDLKRGGFQWQHTRITDPARTERMWLVLAVATLVLVGIGNDTDVVPSEPDPTASSTTEGSMRRSQPLSFLRRGHLRMLANLFQSKPMPTPRFLAQAWPGYDTS
jgi:hypothetical protein